MTSSQSQQPARYLLYVSELYALAVLRPLQAAISAQGGEAAWFFDGPGREHLGRDEHALESVESVLSFNPEAVFVPGNRVPDFFPGLKVEVFHGFSVGKRSDRRGHFRIRGMFDLYCTQGSTTTPRFRELAKRYGYFEVEETGWPKVDPLFSPSPAAERWRSGWARDLPVLLYASTFTEKLSSARPLYESIRALAGGGPWNWLITLHPKTSPELVARYRELQGPQLRFAGSEDVIPLLQAADVMVSDTSSIAHEFALLHKPVVTLRNARPGPHLIDIESPSQLPAALELAHSRPPRLMEDIAAFAHAIHPYRDGKSSERVLAATRKCIGRGRVGVKAKPANLWRKLQMRRRLSYYRW